MKNRRPLDEDEFRSYELKSDETKVSARSLMKGAGLTDEEIYRPFIGICNSYSNFFPGHSNLDKIGQAVKDGILMGGGTPIEFGTREQIFDAPREIYTRELIGAAGL